MNILSMLFKKKASHGEVVGKIKAVRYAEIQTIKSANWELYSTCRGAKSKAEILHNLDVVANETIEEDIREDAINDGLWDWYFHQYTLYSITPIVLDYVLNKIMNEEYKAVPEFVEFITACLDCGTKNIYLTKKEIKENLAGNLPIYKLEDIGRFYSHVLLGLAR